MGMSHVRRRVLTLKWGLQKWRSLSARTTNGVFSVHAFVGPHEEEICRVPQ